MIGWRITVVISSLEPGGAQSIAARLCSAWAERGAKLTVIVFRSAEDALTLPAGVELVTLREPLPSGPRSFLQRILDNFRRISKLRKALQASAPDLIVAHMDQTNVLTLLASRGLGVPAIAVEHNSKPEFHAFGRPWAVLRNISYPFAARIVTVSEGIADVFPGFIRRRCLAIHNSIVLPEIDERPKIGGKHIVAMGRLTHQKGFDILIRAFAMLGDSHPDARLTIWGKGPDEQPLRALAGELDVADRVELAGYTERPAEALVQGSVFAFPSRFEGFGLALAEAMGLGLPAVASDCVGGPGEIIEEGVSGLLVPVEDVDALAAALDRILSDPELAAEMSRNAPQVRERFSLANVLQAWDRMLDGVMQERYGRNLDSEVEVQSAGRSDRVEDVG